MYEFHYDYIKNKYDNDSKLFTDTDSLFNEIKTEDAYEDFSSDKEMLVNFISSYFMIFIYSESYLSNDVSNISYSTKHLYIRYDLLLRQHFYSHLLLFYVDYCLLKMNTF